MKKNILLLVLYIFVCLYLLLVIVYNIRNEYFDLVIKILSVIILSSTMFTSLNSNIIKILSSSFLLALIVHLFFLSIFNILLNPSSSFYKQYDDYEEKNEKLVLYVKKNDDNLSDISIIYYKKISLGFSCQKELLFEKNVPLEKIKLIDLNDYFNYLINLKMNTCSRYTYSSLRGIYEEKNN